MDCSYFYLKYLVTLVLNGHCSTVCKVSLSTVDPCGSSSHDSVTNKKLKIMNAFSLLVLLQRGWV